MADRMSKMDRSNRIYAAIDLKSFYASVELMRSGQKMVRQIEAKDR